MKHDPVIVASVWQFGLDLNRSAMAARSPAQSHILKYTSRTWNIIFFIKKFSNIK